MDCIQITQLVINTIIGANTWEKQIKQQLLLDITLFYENKIQLAGQSDALDDTVNYDTLCKNIKEAVENNRYVLIEAVAETIAQQLINTYQPDKIIVTVNKPQALTIAKNISVTITRP